jgi:hypothetical protein
MAERCVKCGNVATCKITRINMLTSWDTHVEYYCNECSYNVRVEHCLQIIHQTGVDEEC